MFSRTSYHFSTYSLWVLVPHVEDYCPNLPNVTFALGPAKLRAQYVCQPLHSLQRQTCTYSTGTQVIYYFAFKLATETGREIKKPTWAQLNKSPPPFHTIRKTKFCRLLAESQRPTEITQMHAVLSVIYPSSILKIPPTTYTHSSCPSFVLHAVPITVFIGE
jgi:hypothetical protein